jgi:AraC-like DNA-binding protein
MSEFVIRSQSLNGFEEAVIELGGIPSDFYRQLKLPSPEQLRQQEFFDYRILIDLFNLAAQELDCPHFGYLVSQHKHPEKQFGLLGLITSTSTDLHEAIRCFARFLKVHSKTGVSELYDDGETTQWSHTIHYPNQTDLLQVYLHAMGVGLKILKMLDSGNVRPTGLHFTFKDSPQYSTLRRRVNLPFTFSSSWNGMTFKRQDLLLPLANANLQRHADLEKEIQGVLSESKHDFTLNMKTIINRAIDIGDPSIDRVAAYLDCNKRTLQRRLTRWDLTFKILLDDLRLFKAKHYLQYSNLSLVDISELLAYNDQSSFSRFFSQKTQTAPLKWRTLHSPIT